MNASVSRLGKVMWNSLLVIFGGACIYAMFWVIWV